jgi:hypothetical protein
MTPSNMGTQSWTLGSQSMEATFRLIATTLGSYVWNPSLTVQGRRKPATHP